MTHRRALTLLLPLLPALFAVAAGAQGTRSDYERMAGLRARFNGKVTRERVTPRWLDEHRFWYRLDLGGGRSEIWLIDARSGEKKPHVPPPGAAEAGIEPLPPRGLRSRAAGAETQVRFENKTAAPVRLFWVDDGGARREYATIPAGESRTLRTFGGHAWVATTESGDDLVGFLPADGGGTAVITGPVRGGAGARPGRGTTGPRRGGPDSPDGRWSAFVKEHNLWVRERATGAEKPLTTDGKAERFLDPPFHWSPDSRRLVAFRTSPEQEHPVHIVESSPRDQLQPRLRTLQYLKPGDRIRQSRPALFHLPEGREIPVADTLFPNPWSVSGGRWRRDSGEFTFIYNQRGHQVLRVVGVDGESGSARTLVEDVSPTFIDYAGKSFSQVLEETDELIWMSERDGWNHLYLFDLRSGKLKHQITRGEWVVRGVDRVDPKARQLWFRAGGIDRDQDPYQVHFCRVSFDGTGLVRLTRGDGSHTVTWSPGNHYLVDTWSRPDRAPVTELRRAGDGELIRVLEEADDSALRAAGWQAPERFVAPARDGRTPIYGLIFRPTTFDPARRYPVIEDIYAGPQSAFVPKEWRAVHSQQELAELGFIVVKIDGMGTSHRSKAFHDVCWRNLGDAGLPDRIAWMRAAAGSRPWMDLDRVGVWGASAGGQNAMRALLAHPEFYKVGVAACGCHDNRMDKIWWNELWMGWPVGPHYDEQSNVTQAHRLQGRLLLIVGEVDTNVDPASTMQVANALIRADKDFELLVVPGAGHGVGGAYGMRRLQDFFVRHLHGAEPRREKP